MKLSDILSRTRNILDDKLSPYLWSDGELVEYLNDGVNYLANKAWLLVDDADSPIASLTLQPGVKSYVIDKRILYTTSVLLLDNSNGTASYLEKTKSEDLLIPFRTDNSSLSKPTRYAENIASGRLSFYPTPDAVYQVNITSVRMPLVPMSETRIDDEPEGTIVYHQYLPFYICYRAYLKNGTETLNTQAADRNRALWDEGVEFTETYLIKQRWYLRDFVFPAPSHVRVNG